MRPVHHLFFKYQSILMLGGCGMGMAPLALYLASAGLRIFVMDDEVNPMVSAVLEKKGIVVLKDLPNGFTCDAVVYSNAIRADHRMRQWALAEELPMYVRGDFVAALMRNKRLVAIVGSHGKTTTTAYLIQGLKRVLGDHFSYILGGFWSDTELLPGHYDGGSDLCVVEVDESDGTMEAFSPAITVIVNLDWDHPDYYPDEEAFIRAFHRLLLRTQECAWLPKNILHNKALIEGVLAQVRPFDGLGLPGGGACLYDFNQQNAGIAKQVIAGLGYSVDAGCFEAFTPLYRRQTVLYDKEGVTVLADYAHHPTEIKALLEAFRNEKRPVYAVFQPHRYTRTARYAEAFAKSLLVAAGVYLLDVYPASESPIAEGQSTAIAQYLPESMCRVWSMGDADLFTHLLRLTEQPVVLLFIGAGDIYGYACDFVKKLRDRYIMAFF